MPYVAPYPKVLLLGGTGTGKTYSIRTLVAAGLTPLVIFTEPGMEVLADIPCPKLHYHYVPPMTLSWADMVENVRKVNMLSFEQLTKLSDPKRNTYTEMQDFVGSMGNFVCDRCGEKLGAIDSLDPTRFAVVNDSLSGINLMAMNTVVGGKPLKNQGEWGLAMDLVEKYVNLFTTGLPCLGVMIAHLERETDEITGGSAVMVSTLGRKLAPRLPRFFSDVIQAKREGAKFTWSTATFNVDLKARNLPIADNLPPDFGPLLAAFHSRAGVTK